MALLAALPARPKPPQPEEVAAHKRLLARGYKRAEQLEPKLADALQPILARAGDEAARRFTQLATVHLTAAGETPTPSGWSAPSGDELVNVAGLVAQLRTKTDPIRQAVVEQQMTPALQEAGLAWDVTNPAIGAVLSSTGSKITNIAETTRQNVMRIVSESYNQGLSVPDTATAIRVGMREASQVRATMIARTELAGATAGGSLTATSMVGEATGVQYFKVWMTAPGAAHPRHENYEGLNNQTQPLDQPFDLEGSPVMYPGDPDGDPGETINCRCTLSYTDRAGEVTDAPEGVDPETGEGTPEFDQGDAEVAASSTIAAAAESEPDTTAFLQAAADRTGGQMVGLDFRLKSQESLTRKIRSKLAANPDVTAEQVAGKITDALRYTMNFDPEKYTAGVESAIKDLTSRGYKQVEVSNYWGPQSPEYKGINSLFQTPDGRTTFELQFHTPDGFALKDGLNHKLYEQYRVTPEFDMQQQLWDQMTQNAAALPVPNDVLRIGDPVGHSGPTLDPRFPRTDTISVGPGAPVPGEMRRTIYEHQLDVWPPKPSQAALDLMHGWDNTQQLYSIPHPGFGGSRAYTAEREQLHHDVIAAHFEGKAPPTAENRHAFFTAGGGASGKSAAAFRLEGRDWLVARPKSDPLGKPGSSPFGSYLEERPDFVVIDPDRIKAMLPEYQTLRDQNDLYAASAVHEESSDLSKIITKLVYDDGYSVVLDTTGSGANGKFLGKIAEAKTLGYDTEVSMFSIPTNTAIKRAMERGDRSGRYVAIEALKDAHKGASKALTEWKDSPVVDRWRVYDNQSGAPEIVARGEAGSTTIANPDVFESILAKADEGAAPPAPAPVEPPVAKTVPVVAEPVTAEVANFNTTALPADQAAAVRTGADAINAVMRIPNPITVEPLPETDTATARLLRGRDGKIGLAPGTGPDFIPNSVVHEYGHYVDRVLLGPDDYNIPDEVFQALKNSPTMQAVRNDQIEVLKGDIPTRNYFLQGREMWARAFDQYVAEKSGNPVLLAQVNKTLADRLLGFQYWPWPEFKPISEAIDKVLADRGLLREAAQVPVGAPAVSPLTEKVLAAPGFAERTAANRIYDNFKAKDGTTLKQVLDSRAKAGEAFQQDLLRTLGEERPGYGQGIVQTLQGSDADAAAAVTKAARFFPKEWIEAAGPVRVVKSTGAGDAYLRPAIAKDHVPTLSIHGTNEAHVAHEMAHWLEDQNPQLGDAAQQFLAERTAGKPLVPLEDLVTDTAYKGAKGKDGGFVDPYMGRIYDDGTKYAHKATEVVSMGMESLVGGAIRLEDDPGHLDWLLNLLAHGEPTTIPEPVRTVSTLVPGPTPETVATVDAAQAADIAKYAERAGETPEAFRAKLDSMVQQLAPGADLRLRISPSVIDSLIADGRFKSQFETQTSGGLMDNNARREMEKEAFGYPHDLPPEQRPIYGYLGGSTNEAGGMVDSYGEALVRLKDSVKERATVTFTDSLGPAIGRNTLPDPLLQPTARALPDPYQPVRPTLMNISNYYAEAQVHGGLPISDIQEIVFDRQNLAWGEEFATKDIARYEEWVSSAQADMDEAKANGTYYDSPPSRERLDATLARGQELLADAQARLDIYRDGAAALRSRLAKAGIDSRVVKSLAKLDE